MDKGLEVAKILAERVSGKDKEFCENILKQGWCSDKQASVLLKINSRYASKQNRSYKYGYYEECYEENTNSYY